MTASRAKATGLLALLALGACGGRALGPNASDATPPPSTGGAGSSAAATGGAGGTSVAATGGARGTSAGGDVGTAGAPATRLPISGTEAVDRIAAVLWNQPPDAATRAAASGLETTAELTSVVERMLADPRATVGVGAFYRWWLELDGVAALEKDPMLFPDFTPALQADMVDETIAFGVDTTLNMNGSFQTLMTASSSFINARLASIYGVSGVVGDGLRRVPLPGSQRAGLLTQPALQALGSLPTRNSPSHRGAYILRKFYCEQLPAPPPNLAPFIVPPGMTLRAALRDQEQNGACGACHGLLDPPGLAFESFDAIGRARTTDNGAPVDTSGLSILSPFNASVAVVNGPVDLANVVAKEPTAETCLAKQWLSWAIGRALDDGDLPAVTKLATSFSASSFNLKALIVAVLTSDVFLAP